VGKSEDIRPICVLVLAGNFFHGVVGCRGHKVQSETACWLHHLQCIVPINVIFQQNPFLNEALRNEVAAKEKQGRNHGKDLELGFPQEGEHAGRLMLPTKKLTMLPTPSRRAAQAFSDAWAEDGRVSTRRAQSTAWTRGER
jgi:hypothetical protein